MQTRFLIEKVALLNVEDQEDFIVKLYNILEEKGIDRKNIESTHFIHDDLSVILSEDVKIDDYTVNSIKIKIKDTIESYIK